MSQDSIEKIVNDSVSDITTAILLHSDSPEIKELIANCDSHQKKLLIEAITQLAGEAAYQGIAAGMRIHIEVTREKSRSLKLVNH